MVASDEVAVIPSDVVWKLTEKKLKLLADNRTDNVTPIGWPDRADEASSSS
jgi:hypothetical protein